MQLHGDPAPHAAAPRPSTAASLEVRARALWALEDHRARMRSSAALLERSRALCAGRGAVAPASRGAGAAGAPAGEPAPARPRLRLLQGGAAPARTPACGRAGCGRPAAFQPLVVLSCAMREVAIRGMPLRVCAAHAGDLGALARTPEFLDAFRARIRVRGGEDPAAIRVEFEPIA